MKSWILNNWDWWIYKRAFNSLRRLCESNQGFAYLFELHLRDYRAAHPIPKQLELATEAFYSSLRFTPKPESKGELSAAWLGVAEATMRAQAAHAAVAGPSETVKFVDESTADPVEKARRYLKAMGDPRMNSAYFFDDGYPRRGTSQDALATLAVLEQLATQPAPVAQEAAEDTARLDWLLGEGRRMAIDSCDGEYRVVDDTWSLVVTDWMPTPRAAIDAARTERAFYTQRRSNV